MNGVVDTILIREWLNGGLIPLNLCMIFVTVYIVYVSTGFRKGWLHAPGANAACALMWIFIADLVRSVMAWAVLHTQQNLSNVITKGYYTITAAYVYTFTGLIATAATMRLIYVLSKDNWGHKGWIYALVGVGAFLVANGLGAFNRVAHYIIYSTMT